MVAPTVKRWQVIVIVHVLFGWSPIASLTFCNASSDSMSEPVTSTIVNILNVSSSCKSFVNAFASATPGTSHNVWWR